jgi:hypothetical protein
MLFLQVGVCPLSQRETPTGARKSLTHYSRHALPGTTKSGSESKGGRFPKEMPEKNPGYDVESRTGSGEIVRYIEGKSFSENWDDTGRDLR